MIMGERVNLFHLKISAGASSLDLIISGSDLHQSRRMMETGLLREVLL